MRRQRLRLHHCYRNFRRNYIPLSCCRGRRPNLQFPRRSPRYHLVTRPARSAVSAVTSDGEAVTVIVPKLQIAPPAAPPLPPLRDEVRCRHFHRGPFPTKVQLLIFSVAAAR